jgi:hypothetical protein
MIKRTEKRYNTNIAIDIISSLNHLPVREQTNNISADGAYIKSELKTSEGQIIVCAFQLPNDITLYSFFSRVAYIDNTLSNFAIRKNGFGVQFLDVPPFEKLCIRDKLRKHVTVG